MSEEKSESAGEIEYEVHDGIFKAFCDKAGTPVRNGTSVDLGLGKNPTVWKVSLEGTGDNPTRSECMEKNHMRVGWDEHGEKVYETADFSKQRGYNALNAFYSKMQIGDIVMSCYSSKTIDAIGVITGEPEWHDEYAHYKRVRKVNWLVKGINEDIVDLKGQHWGQTYTFDKMWITWHRRAIELHCGQTNTIGINYLFQPCILLRKVEMHSYVSARCCTY